MVDFAVLVDYKVKIQEDQKRDKYLDLSREPRKAMEHGSDIDTNCNWYSLNNPQSGLE